jgi:hypothetical protein
MAKEKVSTDEKFQKQDLDLFETLLAIDKKDYGYYDRLSEEQKKKFVPYMMTHWVSTVKSSSDVQGFYVMSTDGAVNKHLFNEHVQRHPKLQWLMFCAASLGAGKQYHQWIPHLKIGVTSLRDNAKISDVIDYFTKIYPKYSSEDIMTISEAYVLEHKKMHFLAKTYPNLKYSDIKTLASVITEADIEKYEKESGN